MEDICDPVGTVGGTKAKKKKGIIRTTVTRRSIQCDDPNVTATQYVSQWRVFIDILDPEEIDPFDSNFDRVPGLRNVALWKRSKRSTRDESGTFSYLRK